MLQQLTQNVGVINEAVSQKRFLILIDASTAIASYDYELNSLLVEPGSNSRKDVVD